MGSSRRPARSEIGSPERAGPPGGRHRGGVGAPAGVVGQVDLSGERSQEFTRPGLVVGPGPRPGGPGQAGRLARDAPPPARVRRGALPRGRSICLGHDGPGARAGKAWKPGETRADAGARRPERAASACHKSLVPGIRPRPPVPPRGANEIGSGDRPPEGPHRGHRDAGGRPDRRDHRQPRPWVAGVRQRRSTRPPRPTCRPFGPRPIRRCHSPGPSRAPEPIRAGPGILRGRPATGPTRALGARAAEAWASWVDPNRAAQAAFRPAAARRCPSRSGIRPERVILAAHLPPPFGRREVRVSRTGRRIGPFRRVSSPTSSRPRILP